MLIQCKGSGRSAGVSFNTKRAACPACGMIKDLTGAGKFKKHMRTVTNKQLRQMK